MRKKIKRPYRAKRHKKHKDVEVKSTILLQSTVCVLFLLSILILSILDIEIYRNLRNNMEDIFAAEGFINDEFFSGLLGGDEVYVQEDEPAQDTYNPSTDFRIDEDILQELRRHYPYIPATEKKI